MKGIGYYILDENNEPVLCEDLIEWAMWMGKSNRVVALDTIDNIRISTVFLGLDHSFDIIGDEPILFETMIFGGEFDEYQNRYSSRVEALIGHQKAVQKVKNSQNLENRKETHNE